MGRSDDQCPSSSPLTPEQADELISRIRAALMAAQTFGTVMVRVDAEAVHRAGAALQGAQERAYAAVMALTRR